MRRIRYVDRCVSALERLGRDSRFAPVCEREGIARLGLCRRAARGSRHRRGAGDSSRLRFPNGFSTYVFLYHEEVDFARRAANVGWETWYVLRSCARHEGEGSARGQYRVVARKQRSRRRIGSSITAAHGISRFAPRLSLGMRCMPASRVRFTRALAGCARDEAPDAAGGCGSRRHV